MATDVSKQSATAATTPVRFTFADYVRYTEEHDGDFELRGGVIVRMAPENDPHVLTCSELAIYLVLHLDLTRFTPFSGSSFPCSGWAEGPKPDHFVARGRPLDEDRRPTSEDIALVIEIASDDARLKDDKNKAETYASVRIPEYWIVDLLYKNVLVQRDPQGTVYTSIKTKRPGETVTSSAIMGFAVTVDTLLRHAPGAAK
jgi:Uma2 family endonuclease